MSSVSGPGDYKPAAARQQKMAPTALKESAQKLEGAIQPSRKSWKQVAEISKRSNTFGKRNKVNTKPSKEAQATAEFAADIFRSRNRSFGPEAGG